jgi:PIN domain nuclease of toxin-antitoxin system
MLIAQAQSENLVLLTPDSLIAQYPGVRVVW